MPDLQSGMAFAVTSNSPTTGSIAWSGAHLVYDGVDYPIADGSTTKKFVYWVKADPASFRTSDDHPALSPDDAIVFLNKGGVPISVLTATAMEGDLVVPGTVTTNALAAGAITADKIATDAIQARHIVAGSIAAEKLAVSELSAISANMGTMTAGNLTLGANGYIKGGAASYAAGTGIWMGYSDAKYKWRVGTPGGSGAEWNGSEFKIYGPDGTVTLQTGSPIDFSKIGGSTKPENNATAGATFGVNISGKIYAANVSTYIDNAAIGNAQIGGNIQSSNWDGSNGWLLDRSGRLYASSGSFRGDISGASGTFSGTVAAGSVNFASSVGVSHTLWPGYHRLTVPGNLTNMRATLQAGGGSGSIGNPYNYGYLGGAGGGGGGYATAVFGVTPGQVIEVVVGAGGAVQWGNGQNGGDTYVAGYLGVGGGGGGQMAAGNAHPSIGGHAGGSYATPGIAAGPGGHSKMGTGGGTGQAGSGYGAGGGGVPGDTEENGYAYYGKLPGRGADGYALIEFFDNQGVVLRSSFDQLKAELRSQGHSLS